MELWEQRWCSSDSTLLPLLRPGFNSRTWRDMWVEFVVDSRPWSEGFSPGSPVFLPPQKPTRQIPIRPGNRVQSHLVDVPLLNSNSIQFNLVVSLLLFTSQLISQKTGNPGGGGGLEYKKGRGARRLA